MSSRPLPLSVSSTRRPRRRNSSTPNSRLERLDLRRHRRLRDAKRLRRRGEAAALGHGMEGAELGVPHIDFLNG